MKKSLKINAILNAIKQCCAIAFPLITFPYVSRILGNEGYGIYSFSNSVVSYFVLLAGLGISTYAIREGAKIRDNQSKINDFASELFTLNIFSVFISYALLILLIAFSSKLQLYTVFIFVQSLTIPLALIGMDWVNSIYEDYLYITIRYIAVQTLALIAMFTFVSTSDDVLKYCIISVLASSGGNLLNIFYIRKYVHVRIKLCKSIVNHLKPLLILFVNSIAITIYVNSDITMLGVYYSDGVVGIYSFASKIYNIIKQLINAVVIVSIPRIAYLLGNEKEAVNNYLSKIFNSVIMLIFPAIAALCGMPSTIIMIAGGDQYLPGTTVLIVLSIALFFAIVASIFTNCILIVNRDEKKCLISTGISAGVNIGLNFILLPRFGIIGAAITTVIAEFINCCIQGYYSARYFNLKDIHIIEVIKVFIASAPIFFICFLCERSIQNVFIRFGIEFICSVVIYTILLAIGKNKIFNECITWIKNRALHGHIGDAK